MVVEVGKDTDGITWGEGDGAGIGVFCQAGLGSIPMRKGREADRDGRWDRVGRDDVRT